MRAEPDPAAANPAEPNPEPECDDATGDGCDASAHCVDGTCAPDLPPGSSCSDDDQCTTDHCDNGTCCTDGTCCTSASQCPGYTPEGTALCGDPSSCSGERTDVVCGDDFRCDSIVESDGLACEGVARGCGRYADVGCPAECAEACADDADCAPGVPCVDGVCCESACAGPCETCNAAGECVAIAEGQDPDEECDGLRCDDYYAGWFGATCVIRASASREEVACDGARACQTASIICPSQPPGSAVGACRQQDCAQPVPGTCTDTTPGVCFVSPSCQP